jgi:hypothetical protein
MAKYYVTSGREQWIRQAPSSLDVAVAFVEFYCDCEDEDLLDGFIRVSQVGFEIDGPGHEYDSVFDTHSIWQMVNQFVDEDDDLHL